MKIELEDPSAKKIFDALNPELDSVPYKKTSSKLTIDGNKLTIEIEGEDINSIRGTFNSYLNWIKIIDETLRI